MCEFLLEDGDIKVKALPLWLDAGRRRPLSFISHAHADHVGRHRRIICTPATLALLRARSEVSGATAVEFGQVVEVADARITLFPAGHVLGSAQVLIEKNGRRVVYTGDFNLGDSFTAEKARPVACDVMLMECTYGHPRYVFPTRDEISKRLTMFIEASFDASLTPVLLAYSLGKAQEAVKMLEQLGYGAIAHPAVWKMCRVYEQFGVTFPLLSQMGAGPVGRRVVVSPPQRSARDRLGMIGPVRTAILTGWSIDDRARHLYGADEALPFSDHCDFTALLRAARESGASKIYTHHGDAARFAGFLRAEGLDAEPLVPPPQGRLF